MIHVISPMQAVVRCMLAQQLRRFPLRLVIVIPAKCTQGKAVFKLQNVCVCICLAEETMEALLESLVAMGFPRDRAESAISATEGAGVHG
jgi:hypothetical protein